MQQTSTALKTLGVGVGATAVMDLGGELVRAATGVPPLDLALVGRWVGHMRDGVLTHPSIVRATPVRHERALGWATHYAIGTGLAALLVLADRSWLDDPRPVPAMTVGVGSVVAPWFVMQPAFGLGLAASRTPDPGTARLRSLRAHAVYGLGLWLSGRTVHGVSARLARR